MTDLQEAPAAERYGVASKHYTRNGNPAGGTTRALQTGPHQWALLVEWQDGPLGGGIERNGAFVEEVIAAAIDRLEFYQASRFACAENEAAISRLKGALDALEKRTADRRARGVEGTHQV